MLWLGNVFHGSDFMKYGSNSLTVSDAEDTCLDLFELGYVVPTIFNPTLSEAAFLGLSYSNRPRDLKKKPDFGWAHGWDWMCVRQIAFSEEEAQKIAERMYEAADVSSGKSTVMMTDKEKWFDRSEKKFWVKEVWADAPYFHAKIEALHVDLQFIHGRRMVTGIELLDALSRTYYGHETMWDILPHLPGKWARND